MSLPERRANISVIITPNENNTGKSNIKMWKEIEKGMPGYILKACQVENYHLPNMSQTFMNLKILASKYIKQILIEM